MEATGPSVVGFLCRDLSWSKSPCCSFQHSICVLPTSVNRVESSYLYHVTYYFLLRYSIFSEVVLLLSSFLDIQVCMAVCSEPQEVPVKGSPRPGEETSVLLKLMSQSNYWI